MNACPDVTRAQLPDELITIDSQTIKVQSQRVEVPRMPAVVCVGRTLDFRNAGEGGIVSMRNGSTSGDEFLDLSELRDAQRIGCRSGCI
jgi:hypothetical protein